MESYEITKLSSKGQIVLPQAVRKRLKLGAGMQFMVLGDGDMVILKRLEPPAKNDFKRFIKQSRLYAKRAGLTAFDIEKTVREVRASSR